MAIFVDTGAWFAASVPSDDDHIAARAFLEANNEPLLTSDYIYDELLTLFRARGHEIRARDWVQQVQTGRCEFVEVTAADFQEATEVFFRFSDKIWSFTDCTSLILMRRLNTRIAFSLDEHFRQFGTVTVVP